MNLIEFPEVTTVYGKNQSQYRPLPAYVSQDNEGTLVCCWQLTWRERLRLLCTGKVWHSILTFHKLLQPQLLSVEKPPMPPTLKP